jgi:3-dehydroquinate dehydratase-2
VRIAVLNGPNLNLLGSREPDLYGRDTLGDIERAVRQEAERAGAEIAWHQTNHEGGFVELVQGLPQAAAGALVNAGAFTHTSLAIRDAILAVRVPFVEVHLSNIFAREEARRHSLLADLAVGIVAGFGARSYLLGLQALIAHLRGRGA